MKIIPNYSVVNLTNKKSVPVFTQNPINQQNSAETVQPAVSVPQYNIQAPVSYNKIEDIRIGNGLTAHYYKLANGQKVVIVPKKGTTYVKTYVNTGSLNEPDKYRGISHYIEHNLFNGSEALGDKVFFDEVNKMGAYTNASTSFSVTDYVISSNLLEKEDLETKIKLHAGMLQTPKFETDKLEKEKKIVDSEINMYLSDDATKAETLTLKNLFNIKSSAHDLVAGSTDNIDALTRDDVVNYFNNNYYPSNMVTVVTGDVDEKETINLISKYFNAPAKQVQQRYYEPMTPTDKPVRQDLISSKKTGATDIFLGFAGPENANQKDQVYLRAVNHLLFGLSNAKIKKIEQKYSTSIFPIEERLGTRKNDKTAQIIQASVPEEYTENLLKDIYGVITDVSNNPPSDEEFIAIKNQIKKNNSIYLQSSGALNYHLGMDFLNETPYKTAQYNTIIDRMTKTDFINTVRKYYDLNKTALTVVHPKTSSVQSIEDNYNKNKQLSFTGNSSVPPMDLTKVKEYYMPNNFDVILQDSNTDVVNYTLSVFSNDLSPKKAAIGDILNDMLQYCGTKNHKWQELAKISDINGIASTIGGGTHSVKITADFPVEKSASAFALFNENISQPDLTQDLFDKAVKHCKDRYLTKEPSALPAFKKSIYAGTQKAYTYEDKLNSLDSITLEDVKNLYSEIFAKGQGKLVVTGPFSKHPELAQIAFNSVSALPVVQPKDTSLFNVYKPNDKTEVHVIPTNRNQAEIIEGFKFEQTGNLKDDACISILNTIFGDGQASRLFSDLREQRHLAYLVSSQYKCTGNQGVLALKIKTTTNNTETGEKSLDNIRKSIEGFNENIQKIITEKVSEDELKMAKRTIKSDILESIEMNEAQNSILAGASKTPYGTAYLNKEFEIIDSITADDILNTARNIFSGKPIYSISGTQEALDANKEFLDSLKK